MLLTPDSATMLTTELLVRSPLAECRYVPKLTWLPIEPCMVLKKKNTPIAHTDAGITMIKDSVCQCRPLHSIPQNANPPKSTPTIIGAILSPSDPPIRWKENAVAFRSGYIAAKVPNAGACQKEAPLPVIETPTNKSQ